MNVSIHIDGLAELQRKLVELPSRVERKVVRHAVSDGAALVRNDIRARAPVYTGDVAAGHPPPGTLKKSVYMKFIPEQSRNGLTVFYVGCRHGKSRQHVGKKHLNLDAYYFWWVEFGTHKMAARPFIRPAFDEGREDAAAQIINDLKTGISSEVASL